MAHPADLIRQERIVELAKTLIAIPSVTGEEHALADWMTAFFRSLGLSEIERFPVDEAGDSVVGWVGEGDNPGVLLNFHLDTFDVFAGWDTDPFQAHLAGNRLYGLGAHDMKGGVACMLAAVEAIVNSGVSLGGRLLVAATSDEENWSRGAHALIQSGLLKNCAYGIISEPSDAGTLTVGARGRHVFHLTFAGKTVHAAYPGGISALTDAAKVAAKLGEPGTIDLGYHPDFEMSGSMCVIGLHSGGTLILMPEKADLHIDRHILPGQTAAEAAQQIEDLIEMLEIAGRYQISWDNRPTPAPPPFSLPLDSRLVQTVSRHAQAEQGRPIRPILAKSVSDLNHIAIHGNVPSLILGPQGGNTCEANEYVAVDSLAATAKTYLKSTLDLLGWEA